MAATEPEVLIAAGPCNGDAVQTAVLPVRTQAKLQLQQRLDAGYGRRHPRIQHLQRITDYEGNLLHWNDRRQMERLRRMLTLLNGQMEVLQALDEGISADENSREKGIGDYLERKSNYVVALKRSEELHDETLTRQIEELRLAGQNQDGRGTKERLVFNADEFRKISLYGNRLRD